MIRVEDSTGMNPPQSLHLNTDFANGNAIDSPIHLFPEQAGTMQIPEPNTALLLAVLRGLLV